jgi:hypothetical protein
MTTPIAGPRDSFVRRHWGKLALAALVLVPAVVFAAWSAIALTYTYSEGQRVGYNQKLSRKGWICKTWEGELALSNVPGQAPELFRYSVRDAAVAQRIQGLEGARVALTYEQHKGLPTSCFGETEYFATGVTRADESVPGVTPAGTPAPATAPGGASPAAAPGASPTP